MTPASIHLLLEFRSFWLHAKGEGGGADFDLVMERDGDGLPLLRGRHVAGLLRLALARADRWGWFNPIPSQAGVAELLMGSSGNGAPGCLDVRSAIVFGATRTALLADGDLREACFQRLPTTAIDETRGVARDGHLRTVEAALPIRLASRLAFVPADRRAWSRQDPDDTACLALAEANWLHWIETALPALDEAGAKRTRGFGSLAQCEIQDLTGAKP